MNILFLYNLKYCVSARKTLKVCLKPSVSIASAIKSNITFALPPCAAILPRWLFSNSSSFVSSCNANATCPLTSALNDAKAYHNIFFDQNYNWIKMLSVCHGKKMSVYNTPRAARVWTTAVLRSSNLVKTFAAFSWSYLPALYFNKNHYKTCNCYTYQNKNVCRKNVTSNRWHDLLVVGVHLCTF